MVTLRYFASAPGAAEMNRPLPLVSPPEGGEPEVGMH